MKHRFNLLQKLIWGAILGGLCFPIPSLALQFWYSDAYLTSQKISFQILFFLFLFSFLTFVYVIVLIILFIVKKRHKDTTEKIFKKIKIGITLLAISVILFTVLNGPLRYGIGNNFLWKIFGQYYPMLHCEEVGNCNPSASHPLPLY